jgi:hypothetical protein
MLRYSRLWPNGKRNFYNRNYFGFILDYVFNKKANRLAGLNVKLVDTTEEKLSNARKFTE